jgi:precorrin-2 dehydrogenase/sirohydrochlorin ferrochelatase
MNYYPIFLDLRGRQCLVVGGGEVATRKIEGLLNAGAMVTVISPEVTEAIQEWQSQGELRHLPRCYRSGDLRGFFIAYAATGIAEVDQQMAAEARSEGVLLNVVDHPTLCGFINPAVLQRGNLTIAISTGGKSPGFAKLVRQQLENFVGPEYGEALEVVGVKRNELKRSCPNAEERQRLLNEFMESPALDLIRRQR